MDQIDKLAPIDEHGERIFRLRRKRVPNPAFRLKSLTNRPPKLATRGHAPMAARAAAISMVARSAPPLLNSGTTGNGATGQSMLALGAEFGHCAA